MRAVYSVALSASRAALSRALSDHGPEVWARNSYALGTLAPFVSDLDLTLLLEKPLDRAAKKRLIRTMKSLKLVFPFLGEVNSYAKEDLAYLSRVINPFELERDPALKRIVEKTPSQSLRDTASASVFLFRMLESDLKNIHSCPARRVPKWSSHFQAIDTGLGWGSPDKDIQFDPAFPLESLFTKIIHTIHVGDRKEFEEVFHWLELYVSYVFQSVPHEKFSFLLSATPWFWIMAPHHFCSFESPFPALPDQLLGIFVRQIEWELHGILSQQHQMMDRASTRLHLGNLLNLTKRAMISNARQDLWDLKELVAQMQKREFE